MSICLPKTGFIQGLPQRKKLPSLHIISVSEQKIKKPKYLIGGKRRSFRAFMKKSSYTERTKRFSLHKHPIENLPTRDSNNTQSQVFPNRQLGQIKRTLQGFKHVIKPARNERSFSISKIYLKPLVDRPKIVLQNAETSNLELKKNEITTQQSSFESFIMAPRLMDQQAEYRSRLLI